ncbi:MAG: LysR family transcriptional regulator, partial [Sporomusaceae bacterium]|nr:LysR family transcriptional regulator [Sporomusaceae bacterium]
MEFRQLHAFLTVAKTANFSHAAEVLGYAQSTITTQIQLLERELDTKLFDRLGKQVVLTDQGNCFYPYAQQVVSLAAEAKAALASSRVVSGKITIGVPESLCATRLPKVLQEYGQRYPQVKMVLKMGSYTDFTYMLKNNYIDVALFFQREQTHLSLITDTLLPEPIVAVAANHHSFASRKGLRAVDLTGQTIILAEPGCSYRIILEEILDREQIEPETILEIG